MRLELSANSLCFSFGFTGLTGSRLRRLIYSKLCFAAAPAGWISRGFWDVIVDWSISRVHFGLDGFRLSMKCKEDVII